MVQDVYGRGTEREKQEKENELNNKKYMNKGITLEWLRLEFYKCNHAKYRKYADEWLNNLTDAQIEGFERQRIGQIDKSKCV